MGTQSGINNRFFNKTNKIALIKWIITFFIPLIIYNIPTNDLFTDKLRSFMAITLFVILILAFEFFDNLISAIMLPTLYFLAGLVPANIAFASWTNTTVWMVVGALLLTNVLEGCGLLHRIAFWCIRKCGGTFTGTMYGIFFTGVILSFITFANAWVIMMAMGYGVCKAMDLKQSKESALICFAAMMSGQTIVAFLYNPTFLGIGAAGIEKVIPDFSIEWYTMLLYNGPMLLMCVFYIWILSKIYKTKDIEIAGGKEYFDEQYKNMGKLTLKEKKSLVVLAILMVFLFTSPIHKIAPAIGFMTIPYLLYVPGINVGTNNDVHKINFGVIAFVATCMNIGVVGGEVGLSNFVSQIVSPILAGKGTTSALVAMMSIGGLANLFMTPYAMMASLTLPFTQIALDLAINPVAAVMILMISTDILFFPYEATAYVIMYGFGTISIKNFIKFFGGKAILTYIVVILLLIPYWKVLGLV